jgi:hypothetical protein
MPNKIQINSTNSLHLQQLIKFPLDMFIPYMMKGSDLANLVLQSFGKNQMEQRYNY